MNSQLLKQKPFKILGWSLFYLLSIFVLLYIGTYLWINAFLKSEHFKHLITQKAQNTLQADVSLQPTHWDGIYIYSDNFFANHFKNQNIISLKADHLQARPNLSQLCRKSLRFEELLLDRIQLSLKSEALSKTYDLNTKDQIIKPASSWLKKAMVRSAELTWNQGNPWSGKINNTQVVLQSENDDWLIEGTGGELSLADLPVLDIIKLKLRLTESVLYCTESQFRTVDNSRLSASGEISLSRSIPSNLFIRFENVPTSTMISSNVGTKLKGFLTGEARIEGNLQDKTFKSKGKIKMENGQLKALPILDQMALFTDTKQFQEPSFQKAEADFSWEDNTLKVENVIMESAGLLQVRGQFRVENGMIDGEFQVGVVPTCLRWIPGARDRIFTEDKGAYVCTKMRISGPVSHPNEDLSSRLISATTADTMESIEKAVGSVAQGAIDLFPALLGGHASKNNPEQRGTDSER